MVQGSANVIINRPIADVWAFISDVEKNMGKWVEGIYEPELTSEGDMGVDSTFKSKYDFRGKTFDVEFSVTEFSARTRFGTESTDGPFPFRGVVELEPYAGVTRLTNTIEAGPDSVFTRLIFAPMGPLVRGMMRQTDGQGASEPEGAA